MCHFNYFCLFCFVLFFLPFQTIYKGNKSKPPTQWEGEECEQPIERKLIDDILSLQAQVKKLGKIVKKEKRKQKESEELQRKTTEEWEEMKQQFQDMLNTNESKYQLAKIIDKLIHVFTKFD